MEEGFYTTFTRRGNYIAVQAHVDGLMVGSATIAPVPNNPLSPLKVTHRFAPVYADNARYAVKMASRLARQSRALQLGLPTGRYTGRTNGF